MRLGLVLLLAACHASPVPTPTPDRCPIAPMALAMTTPGRPPVRPLTLDAQGRVTVAILGPPLYAKLDPRGCLVGPDGLWAELTPDGKLWTAHEVIDVEGTTIKLAAGAGLRIGKDGAVERIDNSGAVEPNSYGSIAVEGFRQDAPCGGLLLVAAFMSMMPSMAVSDGHPARAPAPAGSLCAAYPRP